MEAEKFCSNCKYCRMEDHEEPCVRCKNTITNLQQVLLNRPFLWEPQEGQNRTGYEEVWKKLQSMVAEDPVNHPKHYESGKYECIDVMAEAIGIEDTKGFCLCNAFKYIYRCTKKHTTPVEDVKKAIWYLKKFLELEGEPDDED